MYFYIEPPQIDQQIQQVTGFTYEHIKSHRLEDGELFWATDLRGKVYECTLSYLDKKKAMAGYKVIKTQIKDSALSHVLIQGIPDKNYLDKMLEVAALAGFSKIILFQAGFSPKYSLNQDRLLKIALQAALLAEFSTLPEIEIWSFKDLCVDKNILKNSLVLSQFGEYSTSVTSADSKYIWVGPEGGWNKTEDDFFTTSNLPLLSLSPNSIYPAWLAGSVWRLQNLR